MEANLRHKSSVINNIFVLLIFSPSSRIVVWYSFNLPLMTKYFVYTLWDYGSVPGSLGLFLVLIQRSTQKNCFFWSINFMSQMASIDRYWTSTTTINVKECQILAANRAYQLGRLNVGSSVYWYFVYSVEIFIWFLFI